MYTTKTIAVEKTVHNFLKIESTKKNISIKKYLSLLLEKDVKEKVLV